MLKSFKGIMMTLMGVSFLATPAYAAVQEWELVRPDGIVITDPVDVNAHPDTLDGKTVVLRWSGKPNGDIMMARVGELIQRDFPKTKVITSWENQPANSLLAAGWSAGRGKSVKMAAAIRDLKLDLVVGGQGD